MKTLTHAGKEYIAVPGNCHENPCPLSNPCDECGVPCSLSLTKERWTDKTEYNINKMAEAFCTWVLPKSVLPDECVMDRNCYRTGTNLLTVEEAKQAIRFMFDSIKDEETK